MTDYSKDLLDDFGSSSESEDESLEQETHQENPIQNGHHKPESEDESFESRLKRALENKPMDERLQCVLRGESIKSVKDIHEFSQVIPLIPELNSRIDKYSNQEESDYSELLSYVNEDVHSQEYQFILTINDISTIINQDIEVFHTLVVNQYKPVFPELESLIQNPIDHARVITTIKQDLANIKNYENDLKGFVSSEKVLVIIMGAIQQVPKQVKLEGSDMDRILSCCTALMELEELLNNLSSFITKKLAKFAPNVSALIGSITTSQLLIATGSLRQLALTPACNLSSLGIKELSSQSKATKSRTTIHSGYLFHSDLIKYLPQDIIRQVLRIVSAKVILAARIDLSNSKPGGELGQKYLEEVQVKIEQLLTPPEQQPNKALPVPVDQKSKKRGGKRFRKLKERTQMSELRKAQNKMEFGKEEDSFVDAYGEEVGLGMSRSSGGSSGRIGQIKVNQNTNARMTKAMANRLQKQSQQQRATLDNFDSILLPASNTASTNSGAAATKLLGNDKWFTGMTKRKLDSNDDGDVKKQKTIGNGSTGI